ncbi:MAG: hypothetical protein K2M20_09490, partial [Lachnospiraceae bacterium]|nr:hypothetical protein [Lachnospiraceae bacterium]
MLTRKNLPVLFTAALLAVSAGACGSENNAPSELEITDISDGGKSAAAEAETAEPSDGGADGSGEDSDTDVTSDIHDAGQQENPVTVTFEKSLDEVKGDDG